MYEIDPEDVCRRTKEMLEDAGAKLKSRQVVAAIQALVENINKSLGALVLDAEGFRVRFPLIKTINVLMEWDRVANTACINERNEDLILFIKQIKEALAMDLNETNVAKVGT